MILEAQNAKFQTSKSNSWISKEKQVQLVANNMEDPNFAYPVFTKKINAAA